MNYDYYQTKTDNKVGLVQTATLVNKAREEVKNSVLFDDGDALQGTPLGDYVANKIKIRRILWILVIHIHYIV